MKRVLAVAICTLSVLIFPAVTFAQFAKGDVVFVIEDAPVQKGLKALGKLPKGSIFEAQEVKKTETGTWVKVEIDTLPTGWIGSEYLQKHSERKEKNEEICRKIHAVGATAKKKFDDLGLIAWDKIAKEQMIAKEYVNSMNEIWADSNGVNPKLHAALREYILGYDCYERNFKVYDDVGKKIFTGVCVQYAGGPKLDFGEIVKNSDDARMNLARTQPVLLEKKRAFNKLAEEIEKRDRTTLTKLGIPHRNILPFIGGSATTKEYREKCFNDPSYDPPFRKLPN